MTDHAEEHLIHLQALMQAHLTHVISSHLCLLKLVPKLGGKTASSWLCLTDAACCIAVKATSIPWLPFSMAPCTSRTSAASWS